MQVHSLTNFCIVDMACIDDISITRSKRVNEKIILRYTVQDNDQFPCKSSGSWFMRIINYDIDMACIIMYCQDP